MCPAGPPAVHGRHAASLPEHRSGVPAGPWVLGLVVRAEPQPEVTTGAREHCRARSALCPQEARAPGSLRLGPRRRVGTAV